MKTELLILVLGIYIFWGTLIAILSSRGKSRSLFDYFLGSRKISPLVNTLSYSATTYSAFMMLGLAGLTYRAGVGALGFELIYLSGLILAVIFGPKFLKFSKESGCITPAELLSLKYNHPLVGIIFAFTSMIFLIPYAASQLMGIGYLLEMLSGGEISFAAGLVIATLLAFLWTEIAGLRSVATTDSLQAMIMLSSSVILVLIVVYKYLGGFGAMMNKLVIDYPQWLSVPGNGFFSFQTFLGLSLPWFFFSISNPQVSQRLFVPQGLKQLRQMILGFSIYGFIYTLITILIGFSARCLFPQLENPDLATPAILSRLNISPWISLLVTVGIFSAAISTIDSIFLTLSSMFVRDILKRHNLPEKGQLIITRSFIPILCLFTFLFAIQRINLIALLSVASSAGLIASVPATIGAFYGKRKRWQAAFFSILSGASTSSILRITGLRPLGMWPGVWTLIVSAIVFWALNTKEGYA